MAEPKREEEKIFSFGAREPEPNVPSFLGDDPPPGGSAPAEESPLVLEIAKLREEKEELLQTLVRRQADFENYRKRIERDRHEEGRRGVERLILDLIPVLDGFDRVLQGHEDPAYAESTDHPDGYILNVFQDGYMFHGRVLRPAIVRVVVHSGEDTKSETLEN